MYLIVFLGLGLSAYAQSGKIYGHTDSGGPSHLYKVEPTTGNITKTIILGKTPPILIEKILPKMIPTSLWQMSVTTLIYR
ncbi:hypothetical protein [Riemerella anatipestifer]|uniref:hypothetical protein n=1 Tax=Riemerella anatipestifer TaxID=34085 RepID=UPI00129E8271|nr:hypothetical protein [Riemerella anatipestifer]